MSEKIDRAWLDVARDAGRSDREGEIWLLKQEVERLRARIAELEAVIKKQLDRGPYWEWQFEARTALAKEGPHDYTALKAARETAAKNARATKERIARAAVAKAGGGEHQSWCATRAKGMAYGPCDCGAKAESGRDE